MRISEILWKAANVHLWDGRGHAYLYEFSCLAVRHVVSPTMWNWLDYKEFSATPVARFMRELGCPILSERAFGQRTFRSAEARQGARYAWLMFASDYAAELEAKGEL